MTSQDVTVVNQLGMHARAAAKFVHLATRYEARVKVARDERDAVDALVALVQSGFGEDLCSA